MTREYYKQLCESFDSLEEMNKSLKRYKLNLKRRSKIVCICRKYVYLGRIYSGIHEKTTRTNKIWLIFEKPVTFLYNGRK